MIDSRFKTNRDLAFDGEAHRCSEFAQTLREFRMIVNRFANEVSEHLSIRPASCLPTTKSLMEPFDSSHAFHKERRALKLEATNRAFP